jgi:hypothetical protein
MLQCWEAIRSSPSAEGGQESTTGRREGGDGNWSKRGKIKQTVSGRNQRNGHVPFGPEVTMSQSLWKSGLPWDTVLP